MAMQYGLACIRLAPVVVIPGLSIFAWAPGLVRVVILLTFAALLVSAASGPATTSTESLTALGSAAVLEFLLGLALAFAVAIPAAALAFAGRLADTQSGFSAANLLNPSLDNEAESLIGTALSISAVVLVFSLDVHLDLLGVIAALADLVPVGSTNWTLDSAALLHAMSLQFSLGLMVALPVVLTMFAIDIGTAYATRSMPQANIYFLALPLKVLVAILVVASSARHFPQLIERMYSEALDSVFRIVI